MRLPRMWFKRIFTISFLLFFFIALCHIELKPVTHTSLSGPETLLPDEPRECSEPRCIPEQVTFSDID